MTSEIKSKDLVAPLNEELERFGLIPLKME